MDSMVPDKHLLIRDLQARLDSVANEKIKNWWEKYMRYVSPFRGVNLVVIREQLRNWYMAHGLAELPTETQFDLALALFEPVYDEDKLAGVLFIEEFLVSKLDCAWSLPRFAALFTDGKITDWNICDWFCVRVLAGLIKREGLPCAQAIARWRTADNLWQARASLVAFAPLVNAKAKPTREMLDLVLETCPYLIKRDERFAKTAVGWVLREASQVAPQEVERFTQEYAPYFSKESLLNATKLIHARGKSSNGGLRQDGVMSSE